MNSTHSSEQIRRAQALTVFGRKCRDNNQTALALSYYEQALEIYPDIRFAVWELAEIYFEMGQWDTALKWCDYGIAIRCTGGGLHKMRIDILSKRHGMDAVFKQYQLTRCDDKYLTLRDDEIGCCAVVRNELERIPFFLDYYRKLGINRFFFVDNDSTDGTIAYLLQQPDVNVWHSPMGFRDASSGSGWFELLLRNYGQRHWWVIADVDELLVYANTENRPLQSLCKTLEKHGKLAASGLLLDMYSHQPVCDTNYSVGESFIDTCPYFDKNFYHTRTRLQNRYRNQDVLIGGMRQRVFSDEHSYLLTKTPLIYYDASTKLYAGHHFSAVETDKIAHEICCVLHFKFFSTIVEQAPLERVRNEYADNAAHYHAYTRNFRTTPTLTLFEPETSIRYEGTAQLEKLGVLQSEPGHYQEICNPFN